MDADGKRAAVEPTWISKKLNHRLNDKGKRAGPFLVKVKLCRYIKYMRLIVRLTVYM